MTPNPFEVLRLDPAATEEEVVRRAARLRQRAADEAELAALRQAVQALTGTPEVRALYALLTHPHPSYAAPELERFVTAFRRPPASTAPPPVVPELDAEEFARLLAATAADELDVLPGPFDPVGPGLSADEAARLAAEALWQSLLYDPRG